MIDRMMLRHLVRIGDVCGLGMRRTRVRILGRGDRGQERDQDKSGEAFHGFASSPGSAVRGSNASAARPVSVRL